MPNQHRQQPISIRLPEHLRAWLFDYASRHDRAVGSVVVGALEEFRARREPEEETGQMRTVTSQNAKEYLRTAFTHHFMRPDQMAWTPIWFPGIQYGSDETLSPEMKARATEHLLGVLRDSGFVIKLGRDIDPLTALHRVLWDQWTKEQLGNGRFTGRLFDDHGRIYRRCTAIDAAGYTTERLAALGGTLRSYTIREDGPPK